MILKKKTSSIQTYANPIYMLTFDCETDMKTIWNIKHICYVKVKWEKYKNSRLVTQCRNCHMFGHGTIYCQNKARCVKCDNQHTTKDCTKTTDTPPTCVNCKGPHLANFSQCPEYLKHVNKIQTKRTANRLRNQYTRNNEVIKRADFPTMSNRQQDNKIINNPTNTNKQQRLYTDVLTNNRIRNFKLKFGV